MTKTFYLLATILFFNVASSFAQFTYTGIKLSYHNVRFDGSSGIAENSTRINDLALNLNIVHRPIRNIGVGVSYRIPLSRGFKYALTDEDETYSIQGGGMFEEDEVDYDGGTLSYNIENTSSTTLIGRFYADIERNIYFDVRYTFENYKERFSYDRLQSPDTPEMNIDYERNTTVKGIGFSIGVSPHISDHFYFGYSATVDFLGTSDSGFSYDIPNLNSNTNQIATVKSKIDDKQVAYEFSYSIGFLF